MVGENQHPTWLELKRPLVCRAAKFHDRFIDVSATKQSFAKVGTDDRIVFTECYRTPQVGYGIGETTLVVQGEAEIVKHGDVSWLSDNGAEERLLRLTRPSQPEQRCPEAAIRLGALGLQQQRLLELLDREAPLPWPDRGAVDKQHAVVDVTDRAFGCRGRGVHPEGFGITPDLYLEPRQEC